MEKIKKVFKIYRYNPEKDEKGYFQEFELEVDPMDRILDVLNYIKWYIDGTLTFRRSCAHGICGSDAMTINNQNGLACQALVKDYKSKVIKIEPLRGFKVEKDLLVNFDDFWAKYKRVMPYFINYDPPPERERYQSPEDQKIIEEASACILCGCCTASCPAYWSNNEYLGTAALYKAFRFIFDTRDQAAEERMKIVDSEEGVWRCHNIMNCVEACPRDLHPADGIAKLKARIIAEKL